MEITHDKRGVRNSFAFHGQVKKVFTPEPMEPSRFFFVREEHILITISKQNSIDYYAYSRVKEHERNRLQ